ncbi:MAG TPA: VanZ family protein [Silvibacterium sp.]|nr:VanZ family protein [Silvibacterium sp.]
MGNSRLHSVRHWIPAALAVLMIAIESTVMMSADNTSRWLLPIWVHLFGPITPAHWATVHHYIRKTGHFTGYGIVSLCFFHGWRKTLHLTSSGVRALWMRSAALAIGCTVLVASADEFHQSFLPSRTGVPQDVVLDTSGAIAVQLLVLLLMPLFIRRKAGIGSFASDID